MKPLTHLDHHFSTSPQISLEDLAHIKAAGFHSIVCNRPDEEDGGVHPDHRQMEAEATRMGLAFAYVPVTPGRIGPVEIKDFRSAIAGLPGPILGYCRLGIRSRILYERSR
ncbi:TIGR01244 family sulfur transferase [Nitrosovibrio sp. Nv17]|uniref:TIGR01244 family sulfur transferase n=1 Tax=Nitrosovibrio sp. Nv17 TaxID=1855339 RepID=UPI0009085773|nr:TIGR01244 family sulfur transferase [Nitrosovibrio sp. Nv17]SFW15539.1 sulfide:quinone oxidoreductase [Nitrosovibrio sp. Nv17]